jgi:hypothetical protein
MLYTYLCTCGTLLEKDFPFAKPQKVKCKCGKKMERVMPKLKYMLAGENWAGKSRV